MAHAAVRQCRAWRDDHRRNGCHLCRARQAPQIGNIVECVDTKNTGHRSRRNRIDPVDNSVGMRRPDHIGPSLPFIVDIVDKDAASSQEAGIL